MKNTAVLLFSIPIPLARKGVVAAISQFLVAHNRSVLHTDDHVDSCRALFLSRLEWDLDGFDIPLAEFAEHFKPVAGRFMIKYHLAPTDYRSKIVILVSSYDHCLADLLYRQSTGEPPCNVAMIVSNHATARSLAEFYKIPFHPLTPSAGQARMRARNARPHRAGVICCQVRTTGEPLNPAIGSSGH